MSGFQVFFYIILPLAFLIAIFLGIAFYKFYFRYYRSRVVSQISARIRKERLLKIDADISRIDLIAKSNQKYRQYFVNLEKLYDTITKSLEKIERDSQEISNEKFTLSFKLFKQKRLALNKALDILDQEEKSFDEVANKVTNQDGFLRSEFTLFLSILRSSSNIYQDNKHLIDWIVPHLDQFLFQAKEWERNFENDMGNGRLDQASKILQDYSRLVVKFVELIDEGPTIQTYIERTIPRLEVNLRNLYNEKKLVILSLDKTSKINETLQTIQNKYAIAKQAYEELKIADAKNEIKEIVKIIKLEENQINGEVFAKQAFEQSYKVILFEFSKAQKYFETLKERMKQDFQKGLNLPRRDLEVLNSEVEKNFQDISDRLVKIDQIAFVFDQTFSSKVAKSKIVVQILTEAFIRLNKISEKIWLANAELLQMKNKLKRIESVINEVSSNSHENNVDLTDSEKQERVKILERLTVLNNRINNEKIDGFFTSDLNLLEQNTVAFYKTVMSRVQLAEITSNLIREFSPKRAINHQIDMIMKKMQRLYLDGKYYEAIDHMLSYLESLGQKKDKKGKRVN